VKKLFVTGLICVLINSSLSAMGELDKKLDAMQQTIAKVKNGPLKKMLQNGLQGIRDCLAEKDGVVQRDQVKTVQQQAKKEQPKRTASLTPVELIEKYYPDLNVALTSLVSVYNDATQFITIKNKDLKLQSAKVERVGEPHLELLDDEKESLKDLSESFIAGTWIAQVSDQINNLAIEDSNDVTPDQNKRVKLYVLRKLQELYSVLFSNSIFNRYINGDADFKKTKQNKSQALKKLLNNKIETLK